MDNSNEKLLDHALQLRGKVQALEELVDLAAEMRKAQKEYFRTRNHDVLNQSKSLERKFDKAVEQYKAGIQSPSLF